MYRHYAICITIIIFIVIINTITYNYTQGSIKSLIEKLQEIKELVTDQNYDMSKNEMNNLNDEWSKRYDVLTVYLEHDELEKVKIELVSLEANIETKDYEQATIDINRAIFLLEHIKQKITLEIKNIF